LNSTFLWEFMQTSSAPEQSEDAVTDLESKRNELSALLEEFAVGRNSNAKDSVKQEVGDAIGLPSEMPLTLTEWFLSFHQALACLVMLYIALKPRTDVQKLTRPNFSESLLMKMDDALQFRVMGAVQAVIERRSEELERVDQAESDEGSDEDDDDVGGQQKGKKNNGAGQGA
jgi:hypothetical protein